MQCFQSKRSAIGLLLLLPLLLMAALKGFFAPENQLLVFVLTSQIMIAIGLLWFLHRVEGQIPLFDIGYFLIFFTIVYSAYPLFSFAMSGFQWGAISDYRLRTYNVTPRELGIFSLHHLAYIMALVLGYVTLRNRIVRLSELPRKASIDRVSISMIFLSYIGIVGYFQMLQLSSFVELPHFILQINHNLASIKFVLSIALMYLAFSNWKNKWFRAAVALYLLIQLMFLLTGYHGRVYFFLTLLAAVMIYHRVVSPFTLRQAIFWFSIALVFFICWGFRKANIFYYFGEHSLWAATNEFTSVLGTAYDLYFRKEVVASLSETVYMQNNSDLQYRPVSPLGDIPKTLLFNDILLLIPSQFLPFYKWSTSQWYLELIGLRGTGVGMTFGVISQGIIGGGVFELIVRGLTLGAFAAFCHNLYIKRASSFWVNIGYIFIAVRIYDTYRAGTGYIFYDILYQLLPCVIVILSASWFGRLVLKRQRS